MSLRQKIYNGGLILVARQLSGAAIGLGGVMLLASLLAPSEYGLWAAQQGIFLYAVAVFQSGLNVVLTRRPDDRVQADSDRVFTLLLILGILGGGAVALAAPLLEDFSNLDGLAALIQVSMLLLPVKLAAMVPLAWAERRLDYRTVALVELVGQICLYAVGVPLAYAGWSYWAPVTGFACQVLVQAAILFALAPRRPRLGRIDGAALGLLRDGAALQASLLIYNLRNLVNPLIIGRFAGAEAVGLVALAIKLCEQAAFIRGITWRMSIPVLGRLRDEPTRLARAVGEGMELQLLVMIPVMLGFSLSAPWLLPLLFGQAWGPVAGLVPFIVVGVMVNAAFNLHSSALYLLGRIWPVSLMHLVHVGLLAGATWLLAPAHGILAFGLAELAAATAYAIVHLALTRAIGPVRIGLSVVWLGVSLLVLFHGVFGWVALLAAGGVFALPATRRAIMRYWDSFARPRLAAFQAGGD